MNNNSIRSLETTSASSTSSENYSKLIHQHQHQPIFGSVLTNLMEPTASGYPGICLMPSNPISIPNVNISRQSHDHSASLNDLSFQSSSPHPSSQPSHNPGPMYQALLPFLTPLDARVYPFQASQYLSAFSNSLHHSNSGPCLYNQTSPTSTLSSSLPATYSGYSPSASSNDPLRITPSSWYNANLAPNQYNQLVYQLSTLGHPTGSLSQSSVNHAITSSANADNITSLKRPLVLSNQDNNKLSEKPSKKEVIKRKRKSIKRSSSSERGANYQISSLAPNGTVRTLLQTADAEDHFNKALKAKDLKYLENTTNGLSDSGTINHSVEAHFEKSLANFRKSDSPSSHSNSIQKSRCISISSDGGNSAISSLATSGLNEEAKYSVETSRNPSISQSHSSSSTSCSPTSQLGEEEANNTTEETTSVWDISYQNSSTIIKPRSFKPKQAWLSQYDKIIRC